MNIILAGPPASGKGTQASLLQKSLNLTIISTGELLRQEIRSKSRLGTDIEHLVECGELVPDEIIMKLTRERLNAPDVGGGFLMDGFPRTATQAAALRKDGVDVDHLVLLDVPDFICIRRITGRRTDPLTGQVYHMDRLPEDDQELVDRLVCRSDDTVDVIRRRLDIFHENFSAILPHFEKELRSVPFLTTDTPASVHDRILRIIKPE
eukprot:gnl/Dysnectes_brevis/2062_a2383_3407.p1 GENE.gnl/Dysnectes_brevis/2062_a2383_3407~~gnl/Dysnectes_brevis/2062_a2383_3407.p1  ORF type:complete len:208 (+),score=30.74 gnl/Dysnectes_brevis/2062_a2383_3407:52-675(+)